MASITTEHPYHGQQCPECDGPVALLRKEFSSNHGLSITYSARCSSGQQHELSAETAADLLQRNGRV